MAVGFRWGAMNEDTGLYVYYSSGPVNVGKINKEGKAEYIERVVNVTKYPNKKIVEFLEDIILYHSPKGLSDDYYLELYKLREKFK